MIIKECKGYELEKSKKNTSEDFFNKSEVTFIDNGNEKILTILYVRYFDEVMGEFTPFQEDPIFQAGGRSVYFRDIVAIACLMKKPEFRRRKKVYINSQSEFASFFKEADYDKIKSIFESIESSGTYELSLPQDDAAAVR